MSSKNKIILLTLIVSLGFLTRDTLMISGPLNMTPVYINFFAALVLSFLLIIATENKRTHNHAKATLALVGASVSILSILSAYLLELDSYQDMSLVAGLEANLLRAVDNISNYGYLIILAAILFGLLLGSDKNRRTTYSYKSSKHISSSQKK